MPIYEYRCSSCGHQEEFIQKVTAEPITRCSQCGKDTFTKMLTAAGFQLKGSGWYATDFKGGGKPAVKPGEAKADAKADGKSEAKSEGKSDAKSDAKPDAKPDTKPSTASDKGSTAGGKASSTGPSGT